MNAREAAVGPERVDDRFRRSIAERRDLGRQPFSCVAQGDGMFAAHGCLLKNLVEVGDLHRRVPVQMLASKLLPSLCPSAKLRLGDRGGHAGMQPGGEEQCGAGE